MLTKDTKLTRLFFPNVPACDRVFGFTCGYIAVLGKDRDFVATEEYRQGWDEGKSLRFDEMVAASRFRGTSKQSGG
jgi:hypothetical protein